MRTTTLAACFLIASLAGYSQILPVLPSEPPPSWSLTPADSLVHGPYAEFAMMYAKRVTADDIIRYAAFRIAQEKALSISIQSELDTANKGKLNLAIQLQEYQEENAMQSMNLVECGSTVLRQKPWVFVGKTFTVVVVAGVAYLIYQELKP